LHKVTIAGNLSVSGGNKPPGQPKPVSGERKKYETRLRLIPNTMKTCKIVLLQDGNGFEVSRFSNTVQLSIGMRVPASRVAEWCAMSRVQVDIVGTVKRDDDSELDLSDCPPVREIVRTDTLSMIQNADKSGQPQNPF
jgi:hypothetical protein